MEAISTAVTDLMGFAGTMLTTITSNAVLTLFLAVPIVGAAIGAAAAWKKFKTSPAFKANYKKAIGKTVLIGVGVAIIGGFLGHKVNQLKNTYEDNKNKPIGQRENVGHLGKNIGKAASDADKFITGKGHLKLSTRGIVK